MDMYQWEIGLILIVFAIGYSAIILEYYLKVNKTAVALLLAVVCWVVHVVFDSVPLSQDLKALEHHVAEVSQIIFFLMGAMTLVELIDCHRGFKIITDRIQTKSKKKMLWIIAAISFVLSSVLDNLTTTILMVSLLRKIVPERAERLLFCCIVVIAANAGGAWTPIGDVTTTMLWINGQLSTTSVIKALVLPSVVCLLIPLFWYTLQSRGKLAIKKLPEKETALQPGAKVVLCLGVAGLVFVPIFKSLTGLPPFMGVLLALAILWLVTDLMHYPYEERTQLRVPHILTRVDISGVLFFLGILLTVDALQTAGILQILANWLDTTVKNQALIATLIGLISAVIDNVPLVAATMGMYPLQGYPMDIPLWHMIAYAAGTGGSILIVGSSSGVALMGMEKIDFVTYMKKATLPAAAGYFGGMGVYLLLKSFWA
jgi:NhaD family Na+/H+ antiporter